MPTIKLSIEVSGQFVLDVMTNMVESGGSSYWAQFTNVHRSKETNDITQFDVIERDVEGASPFTIEWFDVTEAIESIMSKRYKYLDEYVVEYIRRGVCDNDAGEIDADATDAILQVALLGEIRYG